MGGGYGGESLLVVALQRVGDGDGVELMQCIRESHLTTLPVPPLTPHNLSLTIKLLFTVVNPNKVGIKYGELRFTVMYRGIPLGKAYVPVFYQEAHSVRQVVATISIDRVNLLKADAACRKQGHDGMTKRRLWDDLEKYLFGFDGPVPAPTYHLLQ
ncbi:Late embryogenesis abundant protein [Sesbania bispinosa]|nr:Late embryogenesis abundant protein [Sesbania bispinosa]